MPRVIQKELRPYEFHGVQLESREGDPQAVGQCPFCDKEGKFSVAVETGLWRCWSCGTGTEKGGGNASVFLLKLWEAGTTEGIEELAESRGIAVETLQAWGVVKSPITHDWLVPGYGPDGKLKQLYRYLQDSDGKMKLLPTPTLHHHLHGAQLYDPKKPILYLCEGPWDGMILWESLKRIKRGYGDQLSYTSSESASLLADANVLSVPGCQSFADIWLPLFKEKSTRLMYDSDHPREQENGKTIPPAGYSGMRRVAQLLAKAEQAPKEVLYLNWGDGGFDASLKSGYDIRDWLTADQRTNQLKTLLEKVVPIPDDWVGGRTSSAVKRGGLDIDCVECPDWATLVNSWRKAMKWTEGLDRALSVMLASAMSTKCLGDPLWVKIIGPPSSGKSTLCEALSVAKRYVYANSTITGFHSGWKTDKSGEEDHSLIPKIKNKTLITKDGDTLLSAANKDKILSEARDLYDCVARVHYGNAVSREYDDVRMTWLLCGTESLRALDGSELGERFLDCVVMEKIDEDLEREINRRVIYRSIRNVAILADGKMETRTDADMTLAKQLTGGYVCHLRENAAELLGAIVMSDAAAERCIDLGTFVAYMRARPSKKQEETQGREFSSRLVSQIGRLSICLAAVMSKKTVEVGDEVMRRAARVALDTARGRTLEIARHLFKAGKKGLAAATLVAYTNETDDKMRHMIRFLRKIGAVESFSPKTDAGGLSSRVRYRLTDRLETLYREVYSDATNKEA